MAIPASDRFGVKANRPAVSIDFDAPFAPTTQTYHGFSIQVDGAVIGRMTQWTPVSLDRAMTHIMELNPGTYGQPVDLVPGVASTFTLAYGRAEVWGAEVEVALGETDPYTLLINQNRPFSIDEVYARGTSIYRQYRYLGVWFASKSTDGFSSDGDGVIRVSGDFAFVNRIRII